MSLVDGRLYGDSEECVSTASASDLPLVARPKMQLSTKGAFCCASTIDQASLPKAVITALLGKIDVVEGAT